jgi:hypothetical protein
MQNIFVKLFLVVWLELYLILHLRRTTKQEKGTEAFPSSIYSLGKRLNFKADYGPR